jgi:hypothetical protein
MSEVRSTITSYEVTIWPEECSCIDSALYCCTVVYQGHGNWSVRRGSGSGPNDNRPCLGKDGQWHYENLPSERTREELAEHRFDVVTAVGMARKMAPKVTINGLTAEEALARHQHGAWCREPYSVD